MMHRLLSWALLIVCGLILYGLLMHPLVQHVALQRADLIRAQQRLALTQGLIDNADATAATLVRAQAAETREIFLPDDRPELAVAHLQRQLKQLIEASGAQYQSAAVQQVAEDPTQPAEIGEVRVRASFVGDADAVLAVLFEIEAGRPLLYVTSANMSRRAMRGRTATPVEVQVMVNLEVAGLFWRGQAP